MIRKLASLFVGETNNTLIQLFRYTFVGGLAFVVGGAMWAFTRHEEGAKRFGQAIVGIAVMIGAANIVAALAFVGALV